MTDTTNVPQPTFGPLGFQIPQESAILQGVQEDIQAAFNAQGFVLNPSLVTPQGQLASSMAAEIGNVNDTFLYFSTQTDPAFAQGRWQDAIGRIYFIERIPGQSTVINVTCIGLVNTVIPAGTLLQDTLGNQYYSLQAVTIPITGTVNNSFAAVIPGPLAIPNTVVIFQGIPGWDTATIVSGVIGSATETRQAFEARRALSVALNSIGSLPSVLGAVLSVPGVIDAFVTENVNNTVATIGGYSLLPNSIYVAVVGGAAQDIAFAIWSKKAPGCAYNGNTFETVLDMSAGYVPPYPAYTVAFERPIQLETLFLVSIFDNSAIPADYITEIQTAIINAFAGEDGGPRARIGTELFASRFYAPVIALGAWAQLVNIKIGTANSPEVVFIGFITGTTLTITSVISGIVAVGQTITDLGGFVLPGTTILTGSGFVWTVSVTQTVALERMYAILADNDDMTVNIDQIPVVSAANIAIEIV